MGRQDLTSHEEGKKHLKNINGSNLSSLLNSTNFSHVSNENTDTKVSDLSKFISKEDATTAEVIWAKKLVMTQSSYNSFKDAAEILKSMFSISKITNSDFSLVIFKNKHIC